jgi:hypothetical protein
VNNRSAELFDGSTVQPAEDPVARTVDERARKRIKRKRDEEKEEKEEGNTEGICLGSIIEKDQPGSMGDFPTVTRLTETAEGSQLWGCTEYH